MKRIVIFLAFICFSNINFAQEIQLIPYASYMWGGKVNFYNGDIKVNDSENYGIALNVLMPTGTALEIGYMLQPTDMDVRDYTGAIAQYENYELNNNWFQIGAMQHIDKGNISPFAGVTLGALYSNPQSSEISDIWKFAMTGRIGIKYYISDKIGIRLHAGMLIPIQWGGFGFYFGSGGSGTSATVSSAIIQGEIGGGLVFRLNGN